MSYPGEITALTAALLFALSSLGFAMATQRVGSFVVNQLRIFLAMLLLLLIHVATMGNAWPEFLSSRQAWYLVLSGVVGLALGDLFYFHALGLVGPRLGTLLMSTFPIFTVLTDGLWRGHWPAARQGAGIAVGLFGIAVVLTEDRGRDRAWSGQLSSATFGLAVCTGLLGAVGQGAGIVLSQEGMQGAAGEPAVDGLSATVVRMLAGLVGMICFLPLRWLLVNWNRSRQRAAAPATWWRDSRALKGIAVGALLGPTLGVWLTQESLKLTDPGICATLIALTPIFMIPIAYLAQGDRASRRAMAGTVIAFVGITMLLWPAAA